MPLRIIAATLATGLAFSPLLALAQATTPPVPEKPAPSLMPERRTATPSDVPATPGDAPPVKSDAARTPTASAPPDTVQSTGGACVHPPCPGKQ